MKHIVFLIIALLLPLALNAKGERRDNALKIAIISDPHVQDAVTYPELLRSMDAQVQSTRMFNENIFGFRAALEDVAKRGIGLVILSGDITDDGQKVAHEAVRNILDEYGDKYGMRFFFTPGNHDPAAPYGKSLLGKGFLKADGSTHTIVGDSSLYLPGYDVNALHTSVGHKEMVDCYRQYGYFPRADYLFWATPFSDYSYEDYSFAKAMNASDMEGRTFTHSGSHKAYETSYVVEPTEGIWLLSIDCGVYLPDNSVAGYKNSGVGYNNTLQHKPYLIPWIKHVCDEAKRLNKRVVAFSHFPLLDFNDGASEALAESWGRDKFDIERIPTEAVRQAMFDAGVRIHFGGHMHIFDTQRMTQGGETMYNIQTPSVATGIPAYRILSFDKRRPLLETVVLNDATGYDTFFGQYQKEYDYSIAHGTTPIWNKEVLHSKNYAELCEWQFRDLVRTRFAVRDLPAILQREMLGKTGLQLLRQIDAKAKGRQSMEEWTGDDLLLDFYRLHYSGTLALPSIPAKRIKEYNILFHAAEQATSDTELIRQMRSFAYAFRCFLNDKDGKRLRLRRSPHLTSPRRGGTGR